MDFTTQNSQPAPHPAHGKAKIKKQRGLKVMSGLLLVGASLLILALVVFSAFGGPVHEYKYVQKDKLQAVFLSNGTLFFGNITSIGKDNLRLINVYYLRQSESSKSTQSSQQTDAANSKTSLVKQGCEAIGPMDEIIINKAQVNYWENLKSDGQVAKKVAEFVQQNPEGQKCQTPSS